MKIKVEYTIDLDGIEAEALGQLAQTLGFSGSRPERIRKMLERDGRHVADAVEDYLCMECGSLLDTTQVGYGSGGPCRKCEAKNECESSEAGS